MNKLLFVRRLVTCSLVPFPKADIITSTKTTTTATLRKFHPRRSILHQDFLFHHLSYQQRFCSCLSCKPSAGTHITVTDTDEIEQLEPSMMRACNKCKGEGQVRARRSKKASFEYKRQVKQAELENRPKPPPPPPRFEPCKSCSGSGLTNSNEGIDVPDTNQTVAIVGGGIGGLALALSLQQRNIHAVVYERDMTVDQRRQGYGLTMQQGAKALKALGYNVSNNDDYSITFGIHSKRHFVFDQDGNQVAQWGLKVWGRPNTKQKDANRQNAHIPRQQLRKLLLHELKPGTVHWGHKLLDYTEVGDDTGNGNNLNDKVQMTFLSTDEHGSSKTKCKSASVLVGADGIRSVVRQIKIGDSVTPLNYLGCIVVLGIVDCPESELTDGETVFQTADGTTRLYAMPFAEGKSMWQLSFPMEEEDAKQLSAQGPAALKAKALERCSEWHDPIPLLLQSSSEDLISGYPVYDRELLRSDQIRSASENIATTPEEIDDYKTKYKSRVTIMGDAAHPMSPFKGQGANQALLDAVLLSRCLYRGFLAEIECNNLSSGENSDSANKVPSELAKYEQQMLKKSGVKVKASAEAAKFLHTDVVLKKGNVTRGAASKLDEEE